MTFSSENPSAEPLLIADHPVLDMLNSVANVDGTPHEFWATDDDVARWLVRTGWVDKAGMLTFKGRFLAQTARQLREVARTLVEKRKVGKRGDPAPLNMFLHNAVSHLELTWSAPSRIEATRAYKQQTAEQLLAPLAEGVAELLANGEFELIRECEHSECTQWFYDRTKSHKRRWCSMALCGNRHKVAEFRRRQAK
jgi:predicted RNA-binding Zn ribbon-like protein